MCKYSFSPHESFVALRSQYIVRNSVGESYLLSTILQYTTKPMIVVVYTSCTIVWQLEEASQQRYVRVSDFFSHESSLTEGSNNKQG